MVVGGRFELLEKLGMGGMGVVFRALDRLLGETLAIKLLPLDRSATAATKRFLNEARLARRVSHANVCRIHDCGIDGSCAYVTMELVRGNVLRARIRESGGLPPAEAHRLAAGIARGLSAIHRTGVVHRDLKSSNVMVREDGGVAILDFGIARQAAEEPRLTLTGHVVGTPEYMSPEQIRGHPVDSRSDVYSLGILLFELYTGALPFAAETPVGLLFKHLNEAPPLESPLARRIPQSVSSLVARCLAKDPADRPSMSDLERQLEDAALPAAVAPTETVASAAVPSRLAGVWTRIGRPGLLASSVAVCAALVASKWSGGTPPVTSVPAPATSQATDLPSAAATSPTASPSRRPTPGLQSTTPAARTPGEPKTGSAGPRAPIRRVVKAPVRPSPIAATPPSVVLRTGTTLLTTLDPMRDMRFARQGDLLTGQVAESIEEAGRVVVPAGARVEGRLEELTRSGDRVLVKVTLTALVLERGKVPLRTGYYSLQTSATRQRPSLGSAILGGVAAGAARAVTGDERVADAARDEMNGNPSLVPDPVRMGARLPFRLVAPVRILLSAREEATR